MRLHGHVHPEFWPVARALVRQLRRSRRGGAAVCVYHRGDCVVDIWGGSQDAAGTPWQADTMSVSFSTTKGVTATALHILVDRGLLDYDDPVAKYWPEFAQAGKERITVRHLLCHQAGLYGIRGLIDDVRRIRDWDYMTDALARAAPALPPGTASAYHGFTYGWLVGEVIQRVAGRPFAEVIQRELAEPLELDGLYVGTPAAQLSRAARLLMANNGTTSAAFERRLRRAQRVLSALRIRFDVTRMIDALLPQNAETFAWDAPETLAASIPAANGLFTARSLATLYAMLAAGGQWHGRRLLSEATLARATEIQTRRMDLVVPFPMHWRLGYHRASTIRGTPPRGFGHYGFGGSGAWADPDRRLAVALVLNSGIGTPFGDLRTAVIGGVALQCATRADKQR
ncbi:MAG TPA: serine hydrolase domain-containing protein [Candidatus Margulisiibacteriota bacterium]|nr:serine hydrolase domain-containing protein [Candidatus Margulisiibacteriota bacterium]